MPNLNVAITGSLDYAKNIGKKGTSSDITFYNLKKGEDTVTIIEPTRYPERIQPLYYAVSMADIAIVIVDAVTPEFGETVVMLDCAKVTAGYIILRNYLDKSQIAPLIKGTVLEGYEYIEDDANLLREKLLEAAVNKPREVNDIPGIVAVDHFFNVRGIGTVILGCVINGTIRTHDTLKALPTDKSTQVRSIQRHDTDCNDAAKGDRVGLGLKNIAFEELDRGYVLTANPGIKQSNSFTAKLNIVRYWQAPITENMVIHLGHWMQYISGKIESVSGDPKSPDVTVSLDKEVIFMPNDKAIIFHLDAGKLRVIGTLELKE